jgi:GT2 family glycosyltransferase
MVPQQLPRVVVGVIDAVIVPTLNQTDRLFRLLDSIDAPVGELVVIDNGLRWPRGHRLHLPVVRHAQHQTLVELPGNLGVAGAWNLGIKTTPWASRWLIVNDDAWFPEGALAELDRLSSSTAVTLSAATPPWSCFVLGCDAVAQVGLFDERFHPAYFEDTDYERRCHIAGIEVVSTAVDVHHDNSSTLASGVGRGDTYMDNLDLHHRKAIDSDTSWGWDLTRRRNLGWENDAR